MLDAVAKHTDKNKTANGGDFNRVQGLGPGDTERKAIRATDGKLSEDQKQGSKLELLGEKPPCKNCQKAMARWAKKNNASVVYKYTGEKGAKGVKGSPGIFTATANAKAPGGVDVKHQSKQGPPVGAVGSNEKEARKTFDSIDPSKGTWNNVPPKVTQADLDVKPGQHPADW